MVDGAGQGKKSQVVITKASDKPAALINNIYRRIEMEIQQDPWSGQPDS